MPATFSTIDAVDVVACSVPTDALESDGTYAWHDTTVVIVTARSGTTRGFGWTYDAVAAAHLASHVLAPEVVGKQVDDIPRSWSAMTRALRNIGRPGVGGTAIAAIDVALWDLKARLLDTSVVALMGRARDAIPAYGSGGFTSYSTERLEAQLRGWAESGIRMVKMKVGRSPEADEGRVAVARKAVGDAVELFVDANGAYSRKQALRFASAFADFGVTWFEEPVSSDDLAGLRLVRDRAPAGMDIAAGEYGWTLFDQRRMLEAEAVDVLQIDGTRCGGFTGFLRAGALCEAMPMPCSAHTSPTLHAHVCCCVPTARHVEYFHDHARIEQRFFDGALVPCDGDLRPDRSAPGLGITPKWADIEPYIVWRSS